MAKKAVVHIHNGVLLSRVPLRGEGSCGGGGAPRDSAGSGATEEGLTSRMRCLGDGTFGTLGLNKVMGVGSSFDRTSVLIRRYTRAF